MLEEPDTFCALGMAAIGDNGSLAPLTKVTQCDVKNTSIKYMRNVEPQLVIYSFSAHNASSKRLRLDLLNPKSKIAMSARRATKTGPYSYGKCRSLFLHENNSTYMTGYFAAPFFEFMYLNFNHLGSVILNFAPRALQI